jgi:hypothetical protein
MESVYKKERKKERNSVLIQMGILTANLHEDSRSWAHESLHRYSARL